MPATPEIYTKDVDFTALALQYPDFSKKLKPNGQLDFSDPGSVRQLTRSLLHRDFDLTLDLPEDRLCPPVPNRFNYILFVQRLLDSTQDDYNDRYNTEKRTIGLDIGTGASAVYPLLACRQRSSWLFLATELDATSRSFAEKNIHTNGLDSRIKIIDTDQSGQSLIPSQHLQRFDRIDILLTNPPFYASEAEMLSLAKQKSRPPNSACTGAPIEMVCAGGEVAFVSKLIRESKLEPNRNQIRWFSSMLGKLGSISIVAQALEDVGCTNYAVTEFVQGQKTRRWCIAWSWMNLRPTPTVARGTDAVDKRYLPFPTEFEIKLGHPVETAVKRAHQSISLLKGLQWRWNSKLMAGVGRSQQGDVWSRHARRKQKALANSDQNMQHDALAMDAADDMKSVEDEEDAKLFAFKISCEPGRSSPGCNVIVRWLQGNEVTTFESFHGWLRRKLVS